MIKVNGKIIEPIKFPDGTKLLKQESCSNAIIKWHYESDDELVTLIFLTRHLRDNGATNIELSMLYVPNARFDRIKDSKEVLTLKYFAEVINWLSFNKVKILDPHSYVSSALFNNLTIYSPKNIINKVITDIDKDDLVLYYPDFGAYKKYSELFPNIQFCYGKKVRDWDSGKILGLEIENEMNIDLNGKTVLMVDDIISYGGSMKYGSDKLKELGVGKIYAYATHTENSVLDKEKGTLIKSLEDGTVKKLFTTNSLFTGEHEKIEVIEL